MNITTLHFKLQPLNRIELPFFKGSTFRGAFGHALKHIVCVVDRPECAGCPLIQKCAYAYLFETRNARGEQVAHPYIIEPPMSDRQFYGPADFIHLSVVLIGRAIDYVPYLVMAFRRMGQRGVGKGAGRFEVLEVSTLSAGKRQLIYNGHDEILYPSEFQVDLDAIKPIEAKTITLHFSTVTALKSGGKITFSPGFETVIMATYRRMKALSVYHNGSSAIELPDRKTHPVQVKNTDLHPASWARYSNRQQKKIGYDGVVGSLTFTGDLTPYIPLLEMGHYVHIGRGTVYGMGKYELEIQ